MVVTSYQGIALSHVPYSDYNGLPNAFDQEVVNGRLDLMDIRWSLQKRYNIYTMMDININLISKPHIYLVKILQFTCTTICRVWIYHWVNQKALVTGME